MRRTPLNRVGKSEVSRTKQRIQKLLTKIVRVRDGGCAFRLYPETGACSGYTAADHIISRQYAATYADTRNVVCLCNRHHIYWKPQHPTEYTNILQEYLDGETWNWLVRARMATNRHHTTYGPVHFVLHDWLMLELGLKQELEHLSQ